MIGVAGLLLTAGLLLFVFSPARVFVGEEKTRVSYLRERKDAVYENLRDLNFEYKAGKLSDADYESLRNSLESEAAAILAEIEQLEAVESR
ncbi:MAG TPA: hypothetical protein VN577_04535 [Terriglobales bacterium]|nr:hypothetical protein [Terriglobales bacterium]